MEVNTWNAPTLGVLRAARKAIEAGRDAVLATVIDVDGSAYRQPGAKMLISPDGDGVGSITAGCLEDSVLRTAAGVRQTGDPQVETFDLRDDDDVWGLGIGCNGAITVHFEPIDSSYTPVIDAYEGGNEIAVFTVLQSDVPGLHEGDRAFWDGEFSVPQRPATRPRALTAAESGPDQPWPVERLASDARPAIKDGRVETVDYDGRTGSATILVEGITPPSSLVVFGTGHDVAPVVEFATKVNFRTTVVGFRGGAATQSRFPRADEVVSTSPADVNEVIDIDDSTGAVVMTHNFVDDRIVLERLIDSAAPYIGMMGPEERFERLITELEGDGRVIDQADKGRVYAPIGLDLGGGSPYQIAQSIVAEATVVLNDRTPRHLREKQGRIHDTPDQ